MGTSGRWRKIGTSDNGLLMLSALALVAVHAATNGQYGLHRDELASMDDARFLSWGYVVYPPFTPLVARVSLELFGASMIGLRLLSSLAQAIAMVLTGLMARELGGGRAAQLTAAWAAALAPVALSSGTMFQYVAFDHLWWVLLAYAVIRLSKTEDARCWLAIGAVAGAGLMTKYTMAFLLAGLSGGVVLTGARRYLASKWLWMGTAVALVIILPNLLWQWRHEFISLEFLRFIHARDVRLGRTDSFLLAQLWKGTSVVTAPIWIAGLCWLFATAGGRRYRMIGWMYAIPLALFLVAKGRDYYLAPAYPMLLAAGAAWGERWVRRLSPTQAGWVRGTVWWAMATSGVAIAALVFPLAPLGSRWWRVADAVHGNFNEELAWQEMTDAVVRAREGLHGEGGRVGILAGDAGEAGALYVYGHARGLPEAISGSNSHWLRGYGDPPPETVITVGFRRVDAEAVFESCEPAGHFEFPFGLENSAIGDRTEIFVCRRPRQPWEVFWKKFRWFG